jgi:hypothetical protein
MIGYSMCYLYIISMESLMSSTVLFGLVLNVSFTQGLTLRRFGKLFSEIKLIKID